MRWSSLLQTEFLVLRPTPTPRSLYFVYRDFTFFVLLFQYNSTIKRFSNSSWCWAPPLSIASTQGITFVFFSSGYLDVSVPRVPPHKLCIHLCVTEVHSAGFPHSEIVGSKDICSSPALIAAYHVFHRLSVPRHPPYALSCLTRLICVGLLHKCQRLAQRLSDSGSIIRSIAETWSIETIWF